MSRFSRILGNFFDDSTSSYDDKSDDPDIYDESNEVNSPNSPIWEGSEVHNNPLGTDTSLPDPNEVTSD